MLLMMERAVPYIALCVTAAIRRRDADFVVDQLDLNRAVECLFKFTLWALNIDGLTVDGDCCLIEDRNGKFTNSAHCSCLSLPDLADELAADTVFTGFAGAHDAFGSCEDCDTETTKHTGNLANTVVEATAWLAVTLDACDRWCVFNDT